MAGFNRPVASWRSARRSQLRAQPRPEGLEAPHRVPFFASSRTTVASRALAATDRPAKPQRGLTWPARRLKTRTLRALRSGRSADELY